MYTVKKYIRINLMSVLPLLAVGCGKHMVVPLAVKSGSTAEVVTLGTITPGEAVMMITAPAGSGETRLSRLLVHENDTVERGAILACLDSETRLRVALASAETDLQARQADLAKTLAGRSTFEIGAQSATVKQMDAELQQKKTDFSRYEQLYRDGVVSQQDFETRKETYTVSVMQLANAQQSLKQSSEVRSVDVNVSRAAVNSATVAVAQAQANLEQACIRSPEAGQVLKINTHPGERIGDGGLIAFAPSSATYAVAEVYETDVARLRIGENAVIQSAALPRRLSGTVSRIDHLVERQQTVNTDTAANTDARVVRVFVAIAPQDVELARKLINLQVTVRFQ